jgi:hypothetical protein
MKYPTQAESPEAPAETFSTALANAKKPKLKEPSQSALELFLIGAEPLDCSGSSAIREASFDGNYLAITYRHGGTISRLPMSAVHAEEFAKAKSKGSWLAEWREKHQRKPATIHQPKLLSFRPVFLKLTKKRRG